MKHGSLFSGIGGFDLASEWMGWDNVFHCEIDKFCQKVLKYYWPNSISYGDITQTDFTIHRGQIDILTGGFPCQPFSMAGKRKGTEDSRHLWPSMLRAIREIQPRWIVGENVFGLLNWSKGLVFDQVCTDLEAEGYEVWPVLLTACGVNAPHKRERVWIIAYSAIQGRKEREQDHGRENTEENGTRMDDRPERFSEFGITADTSNKGLQGRKLNETPDAGGNQRKREGKRQSYWTNFPTQPPICDRNDGLSSRLVDITFPKWRNESIKSMGNAIVPQVAYQIFKVINEINLK